MDAKAAVLVGDRSFEIRQLPVPDAPAPGGAILKVEGCGMCGTDVEQYEGQVARMGQMTFPVIPGHEIIGRLSAVDAATSARIGLKEGDRVAVSGVGPCGACVSCRAGGGCMDSFAYGFRSLNIGSGLWGGFAEYLELVPRTRLSPIREDLSIEDALLFNPLAAGFDWPIRLGGLGVGQSVLITGSGQRGLASVLGAREAGAEQIIVTGLKRDAAKLELARKFGATAALVAEDTDVPAAVRELTRGRGVDVVVETTPLAFQPVKDAVSAVKSGGTIVLGGLKGGHEMPGFPLDEVMLRYIKVVGARGSSEWATGQAIRLVESGRYPLHLMHSHSLPIDQVEHACRMLGGEVAGETPLHISIVPN